VLFLNLTIALIEPKYEVNVGHVARVMANFGYYNLLLVNPLVDLEKARKFSSHGVKILETAKACRFEDLKRFEYLIGTTAISDVSSSNVLRSTVSPHFMADTLRSFNGSICLIFGRDTTGLRNEEIDVLDMLVSIYASPSYPTLNLGHSAAILLYELSKRRFEDAEKVATREQRDRIIKYIATLTKNLGYAEHKLPIVETAVRQLIRKGRPTPREATIILGLFRLADRVAREKDGHRFSKT
jgi:tRNA/rRNA methyltransferase